MLTTLSQSQIYVLDQDEALDFYVGKLGLEVVTDADLGFMRWLTVGVPGQPGREILLERPGPPALDEATAEQVRELITKGAMGGWLIFTTDDCRKTYEVLSAKGVEFIDDSLSTNVLPTLAALEALEGRPVALLVGGQDRGIDYDGLAAALAVPLVFAVLLLAQAVALIVLAFRLRSRELQG